MPIHSGDVKLLKSAVMADVPEGGGAPTGNAIADGVSNAIFPDISELDRAGGRVNLRKTFVQVATDDTDLYFGSNLIVAEPPKDPLVAVTFFSSAATFETRQQATARVEQYLNRGPLLSGYLLENHVAGQRTIQLLQRPGEPPPNIGRTIVLVLNEETAQEQLQYVRVIASEVKTQTFTEIVNGQLTDFQADVVTLEISDALRNNWPGSPATRLFTPANGKTRVRDTVVADAGSYYGVAPLVAPVAIGDVTVKAASVYSQLVPNARTETASLDQRPAAQRLLQLAATPRRVEVSNTPHTMRIRVGQENRGFSWVQILKPFPAPGTVIVSYMALGEWYTLQDDGAGGFTGQGVGTVNYNNGSISITLPSLPDVNTSILLSWGEKSAYTNRSGKAGYRAPEFAWSTPQAPIKPGSVVVKWMSGGTLRTATDNGNGGFTSTDASGEINYPAGKIFLRPTAMIDAGGEFNVDYRYSTTKTENFTDVVVDAGGFATLTLAEQPAPRSVKIDWVTVRNVSASSGVSDFVSESGAEASPTYTTRTELVYTPKPPPPPPPPPAPEPFQSTALVTNQSVITPGDSLLIKLQTTAADGNGTFDWSIRHISGAPLADAFDVTAGSAEVANYAGWFNVFSKATLAEDVAFDVFVTKAGGPQLAATSTLTVDYTAAPSPPPVPPKYLRFSTSSVSNGTVNDYVFRGDAQVMYFSGPVLDGAYLWQILSPDSELWQSLPPEVKRPFTFTYGSFEVKDGVGGFWIRTDPEGPTTPTKFVVEVKRKYDGVTLARTTEQQVLIQPPPQGWQPPPPTVIKVRDPLTTGSAMTTSGSLAVAGMYEGGVDESGKFVFVAVPPTGSNQWGSTYNPPADVGAVWTAADIAAKTKTLVSEQGTPVAYRIWGE